MHDITWILTGGTISRIGAESRRTLRNSFAEAFVKEARFQNAIHLVEVCAKFSLALTEDDIEDMIKAIKNAVTIKVLITCGTDTMVELARSIKALKLPKTIIFTGSFIPYKHPHSDAKMNLAASLAYLQTNHAANTWICMHGTLFDPLKVQKNAEHKRFVLTTATSA